MTDGLDQVISVLQEKLLSRRLSITDALYERFVNGSSDRVVEEIQRQVNKILDERDELLINAIEEITIHIRANQQQTNKVLSVKASNCCCKSECFSTSTR